MTAEDTGNGGNAPSDPLGSRNSSYPAEFFDEPAYLLENPDVAAAIQRGESASGYDHYIKYGLREGRTVPISADEPRNQLVRTAPKAAFGEPSRAINQFFESLLISRGGGVLIVGWIDDASDPVESVRVLGAGWRLTFGGDTLGRSRRFDVEEALVGRGEATGVNHPYAYYGFVFADEPLTVSGPCDVEIVLRSGMRIKMNAAPRLVEDTEIRDILLSSISSASHFGNAHIKAIEGIDRGAAGEILKLNRSITDGITANPYVQRFGGQKARYDGSIIVCLYGKAEFLFLQAALFHSLIGIDRYEFIYVSNSPELSETLLREARASALIYGLDITIVLLSGNSGFGAANNVAARYARSDRLIILNPDVFPMNESWATDHSALVRSLPSDQTKIFGAALYYDDGSLMHGGMHFELDSAVSLEQGRHRVCQLVRVEHYGKGTPAQMPYFTRSRTVPAVTGAFMSCDRGWFEQLGGFTEEYVFGHYEDADLCLKSLQAGVPVWLHDLKLWHLEGRGSTRLPVHEGGSLINRWLFSSTWGETLTQNLLGQDPAHPAFRDAGLGFKAPAPQPRSAVGAVSGGGLR